MPEYTERSCAPGSASRGEADCTHRADGKPIGLGSAGLYPEQADTAAYLRGEACLDRTNLQEVIYLQLYSDSSHAKNIKVANLLLFLPA